MKKISLCIIFIILLFTTNISFSNFYNYEKQKRIKNYYVFFENNFLYDIYKLKEDLNYFSKFFYNNILTKEFYFNNEINYNKINILLNDIHNFKPDYIIIYNDYILNDVILKYSVNKNVKIIFLSYLEYKEKIDNVFVLNNYFDFNLLSNIISRYNIIFKEIYFLCDDTRNCFLKYKSFKNEIQKNEEFKKLKTNFFQFKDDISFKYFLKNEKNNIKNSIIINSINFIKKSNINDILYDEYVNNVLSNNDIDKNNNIYICFKENLCKNNISLKYSSNQLLQILNIFTNANFDSNIKPEVF